MLSHLRASVVLLFLFTALTGLAYPLAMTAAGQLLFPKQAGGSPVVRNGAIVGSDLIGQNFTRAEYFWGRPSAAGAGYDGKASSGSNLGPTSNALAERIAKEAARHDAPAQSIPPELLLASGSGLDPHISPEAARFQADRVAAARGLSRDAVDALIVTHTEHPILGLFGDDRINVLRLNLALDSAKMQAP